jgi:hypothetical protein
VPSAFEHAKVTLGFTDEDFRNALITAKPGLFIYPEQWERWNKVLGIDPSFLDIVAYKITCVAYCDMEAMPYGFSK